jgi:YaiO family outer membrane protein
MTRGALRQGNEEKQLAEDSHRCRGALGLRRFSLLVAWATWLVAAPLTAQSPSDPLTEARGYEVAQQFEQAAISYREYLSKHAEDDEVRTALARVLSWQGQYEEAVRLYKEVLSRHPADTDVRLALARVRSWQRQFGEAQASYRAILREALGNRDAARGLADTLYWTGEYQEALQWYETLATDFTDAELDERLTAVRAELAALTQAQTYRAPVGITRATPTLPFRDYLKIGYGHYTYTNGISDEQNGLIEVAKSIGSRTFVGRVEPLYRFGSHDTPVSGEFYSTLWNKAWGYVGGLGTVNPSFAPTWAMGGELFQGLGVLHSALSFLEPSFGYRHMDYKSTSVDLLIPGVTFYLPYGFWLTEKVYYVAHTGATTLSSQLTWRPTDRLQLYAGGAFGTSSSHIAATQDFSKTASYLIQGGIIVPLAARFSLEASGYYEDRSQSYVRRGGSINVIMHW